MAKTWRQQLEEIGGYENELVPIAAGAVRKIIDELEAAQKDAERYRWLREDCIRATEVIGHYNAASPEWTDYTIDAAIAKEPKC